MEIDVQVTVEYGAKITGCRGNLNWGPVKFACNRCHRGAFVKCNSRRKLVRPFPIQRRVDVWLEEEMILSVVKSLRVLPRWVLALALCALTGAALATEETQDSALVGEADIVYQNGFVYTVDGVRSRAEAFAVRDGKYVAVGSSDDMKAVTGPDTKVVDLEGRMVMPGLVDTHIHALRGALTALGLAFPVTSSVDDIKAAVKKFIAE